MLLYIKLKQYFKDNGIQKKWFASQLGITSQQFSQIVCGYAPLPKKYWQPLVDLTGGKITLADIISDKLHDIEFLETKPGRSPDDCRVFFKRNL